MLRTQLEATVDEPPRARELRDRSGLFQISGSFVQTCPSFSRGYIRRNMDDPQVQEFCTVTGCADPAQAKFFLESQGGDVAMAINAFFGE